MSKPTFAIKRGDLEPPLPLNLMSGDDGADISTATTVKVLARITDSSGTTFGGTIAGPYPADGQVEYVWVAGDTDTVGTYRVEVEVTWPGGRKQTFPPSGYSTVSINADLG